MGTQFIYNLKDVVFLWKNDKSYYLKELVIYIIIGLNRNILKPISVNRYMKIKEIKIREIKKEMTWAEGNCPYCNQLLRAHAKKLLEHNYLQHLNYCEKFKELKERKKK